jgi:dihydroorotase
MSPLPVPVGRAGNLDGVTLRGVRPYGGPPRDVTVHDGRIQRISPPAVGGGGDGLILLPGLVDLHTHLREPGGEEAETIATGTRSAAAGGFTDVFAMANTVPVTDTAARVRRLRELVASAANARVHPVGAITTGLAGERLAALVDMRDAGARLFSDDGKCVDDAGLMFRALRTAAEHGLVLAQHAQSTQIVGGGQVNAGPVAERTGLPPWHPAGEEAVIARDAILAGHAGSPLHVCHLSTRGSVEVIRWAKARGYPVTCEVTPHHLLLTDEAAAPGGRGHTSDPRYKVNPPLRSAEDVAALRQALHDGTIDAVATDHAPHTAASKAQQWCAAPFGMTALETALAVVAEVLTGPDGTDWELLCRLMSGNPARIGGITADAGRPLAEREPATFCLVDPAARWTVSEHDFHSKSSNSPFLGATFRNRVVATAVDGHLTHATEASDRIATNRG